jgi:hypothetical protein
MDKHDANPPSPAPFSASCLDPSKDTRLGESAGKYLKPPRRLIVLVPESELDTANTAQKVWELAHVFGGHVQFLGLCSDVQKEPTLRRQLVTLSAMVADGSKSIDTKIECGENWLSMVKGYWREGDEIVCFAEHRTGLMKKPLSQILEANLNATVYVLSGLYLPNSSRPNWLLGAMAWVGSIGILVGFFWLDVKIVQMPQDWVHTTLLYLSLFLEVGLIWVWNSLF